MADLKISQLSALASSLVASGDELPIVDASASETKKVTADGLVTAGIRLMPTSSIPWAKVDATGMVVPDNSVTAAKLADGAVTTVKVADGAITDAKIAGPIAVSKFANQTANVVLAGPGTGAAAAPTFRRLVSADLPLAGSGVVGGVSVGAGLAVDAAGSLSLPLTVTAGTSSVLTYDQYGRITAARALTGNDLPAATSTTKGAIKPSASFAVDAAGELKLSNAITAGVATKVTFNAEGLITKGESLAATDIPDLDASKIVSGALSGTHIANRSITQQKLADYAFAMIQEGQPSSVSTEHPVGELWFQESTAKLSMWNGNSWMPVGQGALSGQNLRFCGLFDATNGHVTSLTTFGASDGFTIGSAIPPGDNKLTGAYFVCATPGNATAVTAGVTYDAGDWIVCLGQARGWERVDTLNGGGGGGGATNLDSLIDVAITAPATGDVLTYTGSQWINRQGDLDPGTY